jgi:hypothetical protein
MSVQQDLLDICDLSTFTQNIPIEWVASALDLSSQATIRRRRLPADQVCFGWYSAWRCFVTSRFTSRKRKSPSEC